MEKLKQYLADKHKGEFAAQIGVHPAYLSHLLAGRKRPSFELMCTIDRLSKGSVPIDSWRQDQETNGQTF